MKKILNEAFIGLILTKEESEKKLSNESYEKGTVIYHARPIDGNKVLKKDKIKIIEKI